MNASTDTQQRIIESARELIYSRSYTDVGVAEICEHAGVKKGSFYHFFPSKQNLTLAVLDTLYLEFKNDLLDQAFSAQLMPLQRLDKMAELIYRFQQDIFTDTGQMYGCPFGNLGVELSTQDEAIRHKIDAIFTKMKSCIRQALVDAVEQGDVDAIDVDATADAILAYIEGSMLVAKTRNDPEVLRRLLPAMRGIRLYPEQA
ncbi:MAG: TetR/AcrR family transcriptional regulator [Gammaproteobacteria bacterium]